MEMILRNICAEHGLTAISVTVHNTDTANHTTVFIHWAEDEIVTRCVYGTAKTFNDALASAISEKSRQVSEAA